MKKIVLLTATCLMFVISGLYAQSPRGQQEKMTPEQMATRTVERLNKELTLTDKQQAELKTWYAAQAKKRQETMKKNKDNREAMREAMKKDREATDAQLKKVLTADQYKKFKENEKKREAERRNNQGKRGMGQRGPGQGGPGQYGRPSQR